MQLTAELTDQGFTLQDVNINDLDAYLDVKRACYRKYVDEYYGGWIEDVQISMNSDMFNRAMGSTCFQKILHGGIPAGFLSYHEHEDKIGGISIQMMEAARNKGIGSLFLKHITDLSQKTGKPVFLKVFKSNPARNLYGRFGFKTYDETRTHFLMRYNPGINN